MAPIPMDSGDQALQHAEDPRQHLVGGHPADAA